MNQGRIVRLVESEGKTRTLQLEDGRVIERSDGSPSWRNNNPGNLKFEFDGSADKTVRTTRTKDEALAAAQGRYRGIVGLDQWGNAVFETYEAGRDAKIQLLTRRHGDKDVEAMIRGYSVADYSGQTNHASQAAFIYREGDRQGFDLRNKRIGAMSGEELKALADGIQGFEGWFEGQTRELSSARVRQSPTPSHAIYREIDFHFFKSGRNYEYGRPDLPKLDRDPSRLERDLDGDGLYGVDCSAFVWRGLKNAGFNVPGDTAAGFTTHTLFNGNRITPFAQKNFDLIPADEARRTRGSLQPGDIVLFAGTWQHVGVFKEYDDKGRIVFAGSQSSTGPNEVAIEPGKYWDGGKLRIVGALRAKPEFQVREPLHGQPSAPDVSASLEQLGQRLRGLAGTGDPSTAPDLGVANGIPAYLTPGQSSGRSRTTDSTPNGAFSDGRFNAGDTGVGVQMLQARLAGLDYPGRDGRPLVADAEFGPNTRHAVTLFQKDHGLPQTGAADMDTLRTIESAISRQAKHVPDTSRTKEDVREVPPRSTDEQSAPRSVVDAMSPDPGVVRDTRALHAAIELSQIGHEEPRVSLSGGALIGAPGVHPPQAAGGSDAPPQTESKAPADAIDGTQRTTILLDNPAHPNHAMYSVLLNVVHERDRELGRTPDELSKQLAGGLTEQALARGLTSIGSAKFFEDGRLVGMTDTTDPSAEWARTAIGNVGELVGKPLARSSENTSQLNQQIQLSQAQSLTQNAPTQDDPSPKGPRV
ncbi:MAG: peptidoglycan-binding protein [Lysobacter sp.]|nr:peptidoglycan-binding protein [Lysobacter sp.]